MIIRLWFILEIRLHSFDRWFGDLLYFMVYSFIFYFNIHCSYFTKILIIAVPPEAPKGPVRPIVPRVNLRYTIHWGSIISRMSVIISSCNIFYSFSFSRDPSTRPRRLGGITASSTSTWTPNYWTWTVIAFSLIFIWFSSSRTAMTCWTIWSYD